jgi:hypothetical protein
VEHRRGDTIFIHQEEQLVQLTSVNRTLIVGKKLREQCQVTLANPLDRRSCQALGQRAKTVRIHDR